MQGCEVFCKGCFESSEMLPSSLVPQERQLPLVQNPKYRLVRDVWNCGQIQRVDSLYKMADSYRGRAE